MDVVIFSGIATNVPAAPAKVVTLAEAVRPTPLALASGVRPENVQIFLPYVDAYLVASGIEDALGVLNPLRARKLGELIHRRLNGKRAAQA
jgi:uncharacterized protein